MERKEVKRAFKESLLFRKQSLSKFKERLGKKSFKEANEILDELDVATTEELDAKVLDGETPVQALEEALPEEEPAEDVMSEDGTPVDGESEKPLEEDGEPAVKAGEDTLSEDGDEEVEELKESVKKLARRVRYLESVVEDEEVTLTEDGEEDNSAADSSVVSKDTVSEDGEEASEDSLEESEDGELSDDEMPTAPTVAENADVTSEDDTLSEDEELSGDELKELFTGKKF